MKLSMIQNKSTAENENYNEDNNTWLCWKYQESTEVQINHRDLHKEMVSKNYISIILILVSRKSGISKSTIQLDYIANIL